MNLLTKFFSLSLGALLASNFSPSAFVAQKSEAPAVHLDQLFVGGLVYDGSGQAPRKADVGLKGDTIVFIGQSQELSFSAKKIIDIRGQWIAPGFIDMHSHANLETDYGHKALPFLYQGITTTVVGVDGFGTHKISERMKSWEDRGLGINALAYVGHGSIRQTVMGKENRKPNQKELEQMITLVNAGMEEGAFGLSTGLFYVPGTYAGTQEVIALAKAAAAFEGALYDTHDRDLGAVYKGVGYDASVREGIEIIESAGIRGIFSHFNLQGLHNYGRGDVGAGYINEARKRGVDVWAAQHPYTATQSRLSAYTIPSWAAAGGQEAMNARFDNAGQSARILSVTNEMLQIRGGAEKILFTDPRPSLSGKTLAAVAADLEISPAYAAQHILRKGEAYVMNLDLYDANNTQRLAMEPWMMTCTDGATPRPDQEKTHPRAYGAFPMKYRLFFREQSLLTPEFLIRSFSGLAADFLGLKARGYIREGYKADLVIFNPEQYRDLATYENPKLFSQGMQHVLVNGIYAIFEGHMTGNLAGRPLRRSGSN
ncbi:amidohydrolase family protein [Temperatibacter marinus]|uniref:Amidohydrolase family protein n=1 Tax=Temperatibacter marinus TaxID=1456591 RepID=A0AA52EE96_9PROT|nr:amidohydrolase family protein [Temperatibacter marinus]WND03857.1 amidohydrolase family protein [Temperatibacter marinus]